MIFSITGDNAAEVSPLHVGFAGLAQRQHLSSARRARLAVGSAAGLPGDLHSDDIRGPMEYDRDRATRTVGTIHDRPIRPIASWVIELEDDYSTGVDVTAGPGVTWWRWMGKAVLGDPELTHPDAVIVDS